MADEGVLHRLADDLRARLGPTPRPRAPAPEPPHPIAVRWHAEWIGSIDLGAPLLALVAADLDGDHKAELYAVTTREVIALEASPRVRELGRVAFGGDPAVPQPRDPVGAAVVDDGALIASASPWARGLRVTWQAGALRGDAGEPGFELCPGGRVQLAPGRDYFGEGPAAYYAQACVDLVGARGQPLAVRARLSLANRLEVTAGSAAREVRGVGIAFVIADFDRDGTPDLVYSGAGPPGDKDHIAVIALGADARRPLVIKQLAAEGVAGLAAGDVDGDGAPDAIAAVRLAGGTHVDFWRLD